MQGENHHLASSQHSSLNVWIGLDVVSLLLNSCRESNGLLFFPEKDRYGSFSISKSFTDAFRDFEIEQFNRSADGRPPPHRLVAQLVLISTRCNLCTRLLWEEVSPSPNLLQEAFFLNGILTLCSFQVPNSSWFL